MKQFVSTLFLAIAFPVLLFGQANPSYNSFVGSNGIHTAVIGTGNSKKLVVGFKNGTSNFLANTAGILVNNGAGLLSWAAVSQTNLFNSDQFAVGSGIVSIKNGALTTNLDVFNLLLGNANIYTDDGTNLNRNGIPIGGNQIITTNLTVVNASVFQGDTTFEGVTDFSNTSNIFNGPVYFNSNFVFNGTVITNIAQVNSAGFVPVSSGTNFTNSPFRMIAGVPFVTNAFGQDDLLKWQTTNGDLTIGLNTLGGSSFSSTKSMVINSSVGAVALQSIGKLLTLTGNTFSPGESNALHFGTSGTPIADIWMTDSIITATNGVLYVNGVPVGGGGDSFWTTNALGQLVPTNSPSAQQIKLSGVGTGAGFFEGDGLLIRDGGSEIKFYSSPTFLQFLDADRTVVEVDPQNNQGEVARYIWGSRDDLSATTHTIWRDLTNHALMTLHGDGSLSVGAQTNRLSSDGTNPLWDGVPIGGGPWTDDGTSIFPTANPSAMQLADDGSGVNFGIPIDGLARNFRFATDDGTNVSLVLFENTTTNQEVLFQYQPDYNGSGTIGNFDFRLIDDGANNGLSIFSMMSKGQYTVIMDTNGLISVSANGGFHSGSGPTDSASVSISYNAANGEPNIFEFHSEVLSTNGLDYAIQNLQIQQDENADGAQFQKFSEAASSILDVTDYEIAVLSGNQFTLDWTIGLNNSTSYWSFHPTITNGSGGTVLAISSVASLTNTENLLSLTNQNVGVFNVNALGELSISGQPKLIGMSAGGQLTVDGVPAWGGSYWTSNFVVNGSDNISTIASADPNFPGVAQFGVGFSTLAGDNAAFISLSYPATDFSTFQDNANLFLQGHQVGLGMTISNSQSVFLSGEVPGVNATIRDSGKIFYEGDSAGSSSFIIGSGDIFNRGYAVGGGSKITNSFYIFNDGELSGSTAAYTNATQVFNYGHNAGQNAVIQDSWEIFSSGHEAGKGQYLTNAYEIYNQGYDAGENQINSVSFAIYNLGHSAGSNSAYTNSTAIYNFGAGGQNMAGSFTNLYLFGNSSPPDGTANAFMVGGDLTTVSLLGGLLTSTLRDGGAQISLADTNGALNQINIYASTNSGSAMLYTEGSPPTATVPIGNDGRYDFAAGISVGGTNCVTTNITAGLVTFTIRNGLIVGVQ